MRTPSSQPIQLPLPAPIERRFNSLAVAVPPDASMLEKTDLSRSTHVLPGIEGTSAVKSSIVSAAAPPPQSARNNATSSVRNIGGLYERLSGKNPIPSRLHLRQHAVAER